MTIVDVSEFQGQPDWHAAAAAGVTHAWCKVWENRLDRSFAYNWPTMKAAGIPRGAYVFVRPDLYPPETQAGSALAAAGDVGELPWQIDFETAHPAGPAAATDWLLRFGNAIETGTGKRPFLYTYSGFLGNLTAGCTYFPLWIAHYGATTSPATGPWSSWALWQYSSTGSVPGIPGNVDVNRAQPGALQGGDLTPEEHQLLVDLHLFMDAVKQGQYVIRPANGINSGSDIVARIEDAIKAIPQVAANVSVDVNAIATAVAHALGAKLSA